MTIFLACSREGDVIEVASAETFEDAYKDTVGRNSGAFLVELDKQALKKIEVLEKENRM